MYVTVLDKTSYKERHDFDNFSSLIWTERYNEFGDFELVVPNDDNAYTYLRRGNYLTIPDSDRIMIIETKRTTYDPETGFNAILTGRSLESLLSRRIVFEEITTLLPRQVSTIIYDIMRENITDPENLPRHMSKFYTSYTEQDPSMLEIIIQGSTVYDSIKYLCDYIQHGFKIIEYGPYWRFITYSGTDRSYRQNENPYVVFSPEYGNILSSETLFDETNYKNVALISKKDGWNKIYKYYSRDGLSENITDIDRYEVYADGTNITDSEPMYSGLLDYEGEKKLLDHQTTNSYSCTIDPNVLYRYGFDYYLGDIIQIQDAFVKTNSTTDNSARVIEFIRSYSASGFEAYPTFQLL